MIIYASPGSGKSTLIKSVRGWIDGDSYLFSLFRTRFKTEIDDNENKAQVILQCFQRDKEIANACYNKYLQWLREHKGHKYQMQNVLYGSLRFLWLADKVILKQGTVQFDQEVEACDKYNKQYDIIDDYIQRKHLL